ncbi:hypothetical protein ACEN88_25020, partial [Massilia sp. CT11-108]
RARLRDGRRKGAPAGSGPARAGGLSAERDADERKASADEQRKADDAAQCAAARRSEAVLTSGVRIAEMDDKGERVFVTDEEKARRLVQARRVLADCPSR